MENDHPFFSEEFFRCEYSRLSRSIVRLDDDLTFPFVSVNWKTGGRFSRLFRRDEGGNPYVDSRNSRVYARYRGIGLPDYPRSNSACTLVLSALIRFRVNACVRACVYACVLACLREAGSRERIARVCERVAG